MADDDQGRKAIRGFWRKRNCLYGYDIDDVFCEFRGKTRVRGY